MGVILLWFPSGSTHAAELITARTGEHGRFTRVVFEFRDPVRYREPKIIGNGKFYGVFLDSPLLLIVIYLIELPKAFAQSN
jgi:hypothetical protein